jgi:hypothetical protein
MNALKIRSIALASLLALSACAGDIQSAKPTISFTPLQKMNAPDWVLKGSSAYAKDKGRSFYGVASATNIGNSSLLRTAADNRARNDLAKSIQFYSASLMKDYMASTVTIQTLSGVEIIDHWQNPETGELFSLAKLDLSAIKEAAEKSKELNSQVKEYVRKNADALHDQLEKEELKAK